MRTNDPQIEPESKTAGSNSARWQVLIFPGGTEIGLELRQALGWCKEVDLFSAGAPVSNHAPFAFARHFVVPSVHDGGWLPSLQRAVSEQGITHIFPAHDDALLAVAEEAKNLAAKVVTSPLETCRITRSKAATIARLKGIVPVPELWSSANQVTEFPVFLKPDCGQGSQRTAAARTPKDLQALLVEDGDRLILEYLSGPEFTVDCFSDREKGLLYACGRQRRRIKSGIAMDSIRSEDARFYDFASRINGALELHGAWFFQVKTAKDGELKLLEVAPRIGGTSGLSRARGVNLPLLSLYESERLPVQVVAGVYSVEIDRALVNRYRHNLAYRALYVDFDDTLVVHGRINTELLKLLYQALNRGVRLVLVTRHAGDLKAELARYRLQGLFDEVIHLRANEPKADCIQEKGAVLIDDSFAERVAVHAATGIPVFDPSMVEVLLDERL
jgi:carbamoyl-phosphate synthase large subunit